MAELGAIGANGTVGAASISTVTPGVSVISESHKVVTNAAAEFITSSGQSAGAAFVMPARPVSYPTVLGELGGSIVVTDNTLVGTIVQPDGIDGEVI